MAERSYIVVTNAGREDISHSFGLRGIEVERDIFSYRRGEMGLVHPLILDYFFSGAGNPRERNVGTTDLVELCPYEKGDIPVLLWGRKSFLSNDNDYFLIALRDGEFAKIQGTDLESVKEGLNRIRKQERSYVICEPDTEKQWRHLEAFETLMGNRIHEIPMEVRRRKVNDSELRDTEQFYKMLEKLSIWRKRSASSKFRFYSSTNL